MYEFRGVFTRQNCSSLRLDRGKYTLRDLQPSYPFCGVCINSLNDETEYGTLGLENAVTEMIEGGLISGLAIVYTTFGGPIEHITGFEIKDSAIVADSYFDSSDMADDQLLDLFISKMREYGIPLQDSGYFFPFERGFWGE